MKEKTFNKWFNIFVLAGMTIAMVLTTIIKLGTVDEGQFRLIVAAFGSLMGVLSTVCSANGKIWTFIFGVLDVTIYAIMCFLGQRYGNAALHALYFFPMQFVGYFQWKRRGAGSGSESGLAARRLSPKMRLLCSLAFLAASVALYFVLDSLDKSPLTSILKLAVLSDAVSTVCNILGQLLLSTAYMEQWFFWIGVNIFSVVMWTVTLKEDPESFALIYIIKYSFYLLNSINGLRIWMKLSRQTEN